ncbi:MAG: M23 family metallopeptidase [Anaerolineae bacterium]|nr:M23 family metallopeptidase [Anaerolineae bacterium]
MPTRLLALLLLVLFAAFVTLPLVSAQEATPDPVMPTPGLVASPTPIPRPLPLNTLTAERATLEFFFTELEQGQTGLLHVSGAGMAGARARFVNNLIDFFPMPDGFYGLLAVNMEQSPRTYDLDIFVWYDDGTRQTINTQFEVITGGFIKQDVTLAPDKAYLIDPEVERDELARLESVFSTITLERLWDSEGFQLPIPGGELTSPFGAFRTFNQSFQTRHTGWDIRATLGQPIMASAKGTVAFAGFMEIRGNLVVIDHGYGVFTTYAHLGQVHVTRGQSVNEGQVLGTVGNTGRTSGPHFHWEVAVNGGFVDANQFMLMWKPV